MTNAFVNGSNITLKLDGCEEGQHGLVSMYELTFPDYLLEGNGRAVIRTKGHTSMQAEMYIGERVSFPDYGFDIKLVETHQGDIPCDSTATFTLYENDEMADKTIVHDFDAGKEYKLTEEVNEDGLYLEFDPAIPVCTDCEDIKNLSQASDWIMTDNHRVSITIGGKRWVLSGLEKDVDGTYVALGDEESYAILSPHIDFGGCNTQTLSVGDEEFGFMDFSCMYGPCEAMLTKVGEEGSMLSIGTNPKIYNGKFLRVWTFAPGYTYCAKWIDISSFYGIVELSDPVNNVTLVWEDGTSGNPALKSIFVPRSSPIFDELVGEGTPTEPLSNLSESWDGYYAPPIPQPSLPGYDWFSYLLDEEEMDAIGSGEVELISSEPIEHFFIEDAALSIDFSSDSTTTYNATEEYGSTVTARINDSGIALGFEPGLNLYYWKPVRDYLPFRLLNDTWSIISIDNESRELVIGKETAQRYASGYGGEESIVWNVNNQTIVYSERAFGGDDGYAQMNVLNPNLAEATKIVLLREGEATVFGGHVIYLRELCCYSLTNWADTSVYSEIVEFENVIFIWENNQWDEPVLKSISIPSSSSVFDELVEENTSLEIAGGYHILETYNTSSIIMDEGAYVSYLMEEKMLREGLLLELDPSIEICPDCDDGPIEYYDYTDSYRLVMNISGKEWVLSGLQNTSYAVLGNEESYAVLNMGETIDVGDDEIEFADHIWGRENILKSKRTNETLLWKPRPETYEYGNRLVKFWKSLEYNPAFSWVMLSSFYETIELSDPSNNVILTWENETSDNPALKSIFVPASSPIFDKLTAQSSN